MLEGTVYWSLKAMRNRPVFARDGRIGSISDVYFDDVHWHVRYVVIDTGHPMPQREVLVHPAALARAQPRPDCVDLAWTRAEVEWSPDAETDMPVYRQYGVADVAPHGDPHLRSSEVVMDYAVDALDGPFGHIEDMVADDKDWSITGLVVLAASWTGGRRVTVPPAAVRTIDRPARKVQLRAPRTELRRSA
jgi:hypothetical protein